MFFKSTVNDKFLSLCTEVLAGYFNVDSGVVSNWCRVENGKVKVGLPFAAHSQIPALLSDIEKAGGDRDKVDIAIDIEARKTNVQRIPAIKNIIAVASGKGGVGKSTTSINLAFALMQEGAKVGILDADIYGPSVPIMLGNPKAHPESEDGKHMFPMLVGGIQANSIGYLVPEENATIWRGPMASRALQQLTNETLWTDLDYLIVDMPPGTGDIQLTLSQQIPVTAAVIVTTPQDLALADAVKGIAMFNKVDVPVLGLVENMSYYQCRKCGHQEHIFSSGGGEKLAGQFDVELLGQLPLDIQIRQHADGGKPLLLDAPESPMAQAYRETARQISMKLALFGEKDDDNRIAIVEKH